MGKLIIGLLIGLAAGGILTFYFFVGVSSASQAPGVPIQPPDASGQPPGTAQIILKQEFFNEVLTTIFREMNAPAFPLGQMDENRNEPVGYRYETIQNSSSCDGTITILPERGSVQTSVRFDKNTISAPLAFSGSYNSPVGCLQFTGWAQTNLELRFDAAQQAVFGRLNVETVNLEGVNPIFSGFITPLVQSTLNSRVNPIQILDGKQIGLNLPIAATGGTLLARVEDVRAEVSGNALSLYVIYAFDGKPVQ